MNSTPYTVHIYESEATLISRWTLEYPNIETGGDLFGLWLNANEIVIQAAIGPGEKCRRTATSFFQDEQYLSNVGQSLTQDQGLCNVGSWHSHHTMNLPDPSRGDRDTVWKHLPTPGRFVLLIAAIKTETGAAKVQMGFNLFESTIEGNEVTSMKLNILQGESPIRANKAISLKILEGAELHSKKTSYSEPVRNTKPKVNKRTRAEGQEVARPDMKSNGKYDESSGFFQGKHQHAGMHASRHRHQRQPNQDVTCEGVHSTSRYYYSESRTAYHPSYRPYRLKTILRRDGKEFIQLYHFNHPAGMCWDCRDAEMERDRYGNRYVVHRQYEPNCCIIL